MKILVTGAGGMLGSELVKTAQEFGIETVGLNHTDLDICDRDSIINAIAMYSHEIIVNCAGIVKGREESDVQLYHKVNADGARLLASMCDEFLIKMVQISTDCVFRGLNPSKETDICNAVDIYGMSKAAGEVYHPHLTLRMSFIGIGERGLVSWLMKQSGKVDGYINFKWNGLTVHYAAKNIIIAILMDLTGIVHVGGQDTTKYDVLCYLNEYLELGLKIIPTAYPVIDRRLKTIFAYKFDTPPIKKQIKEMASDYYCNPCRA